MSFAFTEEQRLIRDEARRLFDSRFDSDALRRAAESAGGVDRELWAAISQELGWCAMAISEEHGGLGLGPIELALILEAAGRRLAAVPLWSCACAAVALLEAAPAGEARDRWLRSIAVGEATAAVAWARLDDAAALSTPRIVARACAGGYTLDGVSLIAPDLPSADIVLAPARLDDATVLFVLEAKSLQITRLPALDATRPLGRLDLVDFVAAPHTRIDGHGLDPTAADRAVAVALLGLAAEEIGAAQGAADLTLAYIAQRMQFGRTIASFQAIKHRCARLEVDIAEARAALYGAAGSLRADAPEALLDVAGARALASDVAFHAAEDSLQLHGGVGFTWEYDAHFYLKRAQASSCLLGAAADHLERIAAAALDAGARP